jgi:hypothetical protein
MDYNEYEANMDLGQVFLDVMSSVNENGFSFIAPELEKWQEIGQVLISTHSADASYSTDLDISSTLMQKKGKKKKYLTDIENKDTTIFCDGEDCNEDQEVEIDGAYFNSFSLADRVNIILN